MFSVLDVQNIKNVKRDGGNAWAYMEYGVGDVFDLRFPNNPVWFPGNYNKPSLDQLMVLFQTITNPQVGVPGTYITHLVTPVDEFASHDDDPIYPYKRLMCVVGRAEPAFPVPHEWNFFKPNRGVVCNIDTIEKRHGNDASVLEKQTFCWNAFNHLDTTLDITLNEINETSLSKEEADVGLEEGRERFSLCKHKWYERRPEIIEEAKRLAGIENRLFCEVCHFNFVTTYPMLGNGFIECHHRTPIASGGIRQTRVCDLALVCSNCHRMLHKKLQGYGYLTVEELRERFFKPD